MLHGLDREDGRTMAMVLENQRIFNEVETQTAMDPGMRRISIAVVRRAMAMIFAEKWLPVYPSTSPLSLIYYWRHRTNEDGKSIWAKESESIVTSFTKYGETYENVIAGGPDYAADLAKDLAESVLSRAALNIASNVDTYVDRSRNASPLEACIMLREAIAEKVLINKSEKGFFWALVPETHPDDDFDRDKLVPQLQNMGIHVQRREFEKLYNFEDWERYYNRPSFKVNGVLMGFRGEHPGYNGYVSSPYIPVTRQNDRFVMRWGDRLLGEGSKFYGLAALRKLGN
jgi:hypothetical protein